MHFLLVLFRLTALRLLSSSLHGIARKRSLRMFRSSGATGLKALAMTKRQISR